MDALEAVFTRRSARKYSEALPERALALGYPEGGLPNRQMLERKGNPVSWIEGGR